MRNCLKCGNTIPWRVKIGDSFKTLRKRKFCLECSPFGENNRKNLSISDDERFTNRKEQNKKKQKKYIEKHASEIGIENLKEYIRLTQKKMREERKEKLVKELGGKCVKCGYDKSYKALCFHHKNPQDKKFGIAGNVLMKWDKVLEEALKCELLCSNCHMIIHYDV